MTGGADRPAECGAWSKEAILHQAHIWPDSHLPYYLTLVGVFLTAFYMTRQMRFVFFGEYRGHAHRTDQRLGE